VDARDIVRKAVDLDKSNSEIARNYTFVERQETRELDQSGSVKSQKTETFHVLFLEGSPYKRLVARDDRPLSGEEQRDQEAKLNDSKSQRRRETGGQRERRISDWRKRSEKQHAEISEVPDAFDFTITGNEVCKGRAVYRIDGVPRTGYRPKSTFASFFPKVKLALWIDQKDYQAARIEIEAVDTISIGGFLVKLDKGSRIVIEQNRIDHDLWLPGSLSVKAEARMLLVKSFNRETVYTFTNYQKLEPESRLAEARDIEH
jgi:hypothetical protein